MHSAFILSALLMVQPSPAPTNVVASQFLVYSRSIGEPSVEETTQVPYRPGDSCFDWGLLIEVQFRDRSFTEVMQLPAPASDIGSDDEDVQIHVSTDRTSARVEHDFAAGETELAGNWCVAPGDPLGRYTITVSEGARVLHRFDFEVVPDSEAPETV